MNFGQVKHKYYNQTSNVPILSHQNFSHCDARSVRNKTRTCSDIVIDHQINALFPKETWLCVDSDQVAIGELVTPWYKFINVPHPKDSNGGIGIVHQKYLKISDLEKEI